MVYAQKTRTLRIAVITKALGNKQCPNSILISSRCGPRGFFDTPPTAFNIGNEYFRGFGAFLLAFWAVNVSKMPLNDDCLSYFIKN